MGRLKICRLLNWFVNVILLLGSTILCFVVIDSIIILFDLDVAAVRKTAYNFGGNPNLYRHSKDVERLYELIPNSRFESSYLRRADDKDKSEIVFSVDRFGFRSNGLAERSKKKPSGVFRIVAVGCSNTFGYCVSDCQTWPAQLEKFLNQKHPGRFEVWNAGHSSYNLLQKIAYAKQIIKEFEPDLVLLQHFNIGRRAFLNDADYSWFFRRNKELWYENIPLLWGYVVGDVSWHKFLVCNWALYRVVVGLCNYFMISRAWRDKGPDDFLCMNVELRKYFDMCFGFFADKLALVKANDFIAQVKNTDSVRLAVIDNTPSSEDTSFLKNVPLLFISAEVQKDKKPKEYFEIHPPSQVYEWYGRKIADWLIREGLVPVKQGNT